MGRFGDVSGEHTTGGSLEPLLGNAQAGSVRVLDIADVEWVCLFDGLEIFVARSSVFDNFASAFWRLFLEEAVDSVHLIRVSKTGIRDGSSLAGWTDLLFLITLLAEVLAPTGHFCSAHGVFFCCEMLLLLCLCDDR